MPGPREAAAVGSVSCMKAMARLNQMIKHTITDDGDMKVKAMPQTCQTFALLLWRLRLKRNPSSLCMFTITSIPLIIALKSLVCFTRLANKKHSAINISSMMGTRNAASCCNAHASQISQAIVIRFKRQTRCICSQASSRPLPVCTS